MHPPLAPDRRTDIVNCKTTLSLSNDIYAIIEIVILRVYYTIFVGISLFWHFLGITFQLLKLLFWLRITDEGSLPEMRIWSILLIKYELNGVYILVEVSFYIFTLHIKTEDQNLTDVPEFFRYRQRDISRYHGYCTYVIFVLVVHIRLESL